MFSFDDMNQYTAHLLLLYKGIIMQFVDFFYSMIDLLICKYEYFCQEVSGESPIPMGLLYFYIFVFVVMEQSVLASWRLCVIIQNVDVE